MSDDDEETMQSISRRQASSGRLSYGNSVLLHETSRTRVTLVPFFISRTDHTELAVKIITHKKSQLAWVVNSEKSLTLSEQATRKLVSGIRGHLKIAEEPSDGDFLIIRVSEGLAQLGTHDPATIAGSLIKVLSQDDIIKHLQNTELTAELTAAFRGAIRLSEMRTAVGDLRTSLEEGDVAESTYQNWCVKHTWAFGNAYVVRDCVREISPGDHLDLLLPTVIAGYRDVVELKRPNMNVLQYDSSHRNYFFATAVSQAIGQCHRYLDVLHDVAAKGLRDHPEIVAYHPRAIIVIGRSFDWSEDMLRALHGLNRRLSGISIMTYDHLLAQGERLIELLSAPPAPDEPNDDPFACEEDNIPF
jgi:hypothetical protein